VEAVKVWTFGNTVWVLPPMAIDDKPAEKSVATDAGSVSERVSDVIMDVYHGRTTPQQNKALVREVERSGRLKPDADKAVGKAIGG
jgi:hypothetical protein